MVAGRQEVNKHLPLLLNSSKKICLSLQAAGKFEHFVAEGNDALDPNI